MMPCMIDGATAPPEIDIVSMEDTRNVRRPWFRMDIANKVGKMGPSQKKKRMRKLSATNPGLTATTTMSQMVHATKVRMSTPRGVSPT